MPKQPSSTGKASAVGSTATARKTAATVLRHKEERRAESLAEIQAQTDAGTLVIRQMSKTEQAAASEVARETRRRNESRSRRYKSPDDR